MFHSWPSRLPTWLEVLALQAPGRQRRRNEPPMTVLAEMADILAKEMSLQVNGPFALFGHSLGGLLAFEVARRLSAIGHSPSHLFLAARRAPHIESDVPPISQLNDPEFMAALESHWGDLPTVVRAAPELLALFLPIVRADMTMLDTYQFSPSDPLNCRLTVFGGEGDPSVTWDELEAWRQQTTGAFQLVRLPGDHYFPKSAEHQLHQEIVQRLLPPHAYVAPQTGFRQNR